MTIFAFIASLVVALGVIIAGGATKKAFLYAFGAFIVVLLLGLLAAMLIVSSPLWSM